MWCRTDLTETAEHGTAVAPKAGVRPPRPATGKIPAATCTVYGEQVADWGGIDAVMAAWDALGESFPLDDSPSDERC